MLQTDKFVLRLMLLMIYLAGAVGILAAAFLAGSGLTLYLVWFSLSPGINVIAQMAMFTITAIVGLGLAVLWIGGSIWLVVLAFSAALTAQFEDETTDKPKQKREA